MIPGNITLTRDWSFDPTFSKEQYNLSTSNNTHRIFINPVFSSGSDDLEYPMMIDMPKLVGQVLSNLTVTSRPINDPKFPILMTDPNNPNANVQLWDLRYPKHMLCLLSHWPPLLSSNLKTTNPLNNYALGNAGTVNSLCWGIPEYMIVMTIGASGALPTLNGNYGTKLNPTYAEMLVVWSVNQALNSTPDNVTCQEGLCFCY
ncbi:uncharacterized protein DC041_0006130 [Schistosoma bovis]|uniref:Uncharacterized protein n=1 Tax=Schistosoma bovis TaxID=6184 RepID=A0A430Q2C0_SCHBO|nr:uncharacterized protein DC041_0006130 [Schistosoma bovis]